MFDSIERHEVEWYADQDTQILCPFCSTWHHYDVICGCEDERKEAERISQKIFENHELTSAENRFMIIYEMLS